MGFVNDSAGYGWGTRLLHWVTVLLLLGQFVLGYGMESLAEWMYPESDDLSGGDREGDLDHQLVFVHGWVGAAIFALAVIRIAWRWATPLPAWDDRLTESDRRLERWAELIMNALLVLIPVSGFALLYLSGEEREVIGGEWQPPYDLLGGDDLFLAAHVVGHIAFYVALAVHVAIALRRRTLGRIV